MKRKLIFITLLIISLLLIPYHSVKAETYNGEYSIEYLLKNYSVVTLGQRESYGGTDHDIYGNAFGKGDLYSIDYHRSATINGAVLISGNVIKANRYDTSTSLTIGSNSGSNRSYINGNIGNRVEVSNQINDSNYLDFNKMYEEIMKESQSIADNTKYYINNKKLEVSSPGIYTIQNTASLKNVINSIVRNNTLLIKNYDRNSVYVFNYYNEYVYDNTLPNIMIIEPNSSNAVLLSDYIESGNYTGNIIFNFPKAKIIDIRYTDQYMGFYFECWNSTLQKCEGINATIIAPNADVYLNNYFSDDYNFYGTIISNSLRFTTDFQFSNYTLNKKIVETNNYIVDNKDYDDDFYSRNYSIKDLLENYSLVTLGHKTISSNAKLSNFN